jgi:hypothetical protein
MRRAHALRQSRTTNVRHAPCIRIVCACIRSMIAPVTPSAIFAHAHSSRKARPRLSLRRPHARRRSARNEGAQRPAAAGQRIRPRRSSPPDCRRGLRGFSVAHQRRKASSVEATESHWHLDLGRIGRVCATGYGQCSKAAEAYKGLATRFGSTARSRHNSRRPNRLGSSSGVGNSLTSQGRPNARAPHFCRSGFPRSIRLSGRAAARKRRRRRGSQRHHALRDVLTLTASIP